MPDADRKRKSPLICLCNAVSQAELECAIANGCTTLGRIFDETTAGVGACGGSCQPTLRKMLDAWLADGIFPTDPRPEAPARRKSR